MLWSKFVSIAVGALALVAAVTADQAVEGMTISNFTAHPPTPANTSGNSLMNSARPMCFHHPGVDFVGKDISYMRGSVQQCCDMCKIFPECSRYTWTDYNGGTCWFKKLTPFWVLKPGAVSGIVDPTTPHDDPRLVPLIANSGPEQDMPAHDTWNVKTSDVVACHRVCAEDKSCNAYAFSYAESICYLKTKASTPVYKRGVESGIIFKFFG